MALGPADIRAARMADPAPRARDFATTHGITEAELVSAMGAVPLDPHPDRLIPMIERLGEVMALTRNDSAVSEKTGVYSGFRAGPHAALVAGGPIDLRMFPAHWSFAFAVTEGEKRSIQIFDSAGDAVHKVHLRPTSDIAAFEALVAALHLTEGSDGLTLSPRVMPEPAKGDPSRAAALRADWDRMTDTHQFMKVTRTLKMNRLGAYRMIGAPHARPLPPTAVTRVLEGAAARDIPVMVFVGNPGCIQIHTGPVRNIVAMGPWINVLDPGFDLHLRQDHVAEVWHVTKPTQRGPAVSVEAFDADGRLIVQIFGGREARDGTWDALLDDLRAVEA